MSTKKATPKLGWLDFKVKIIATLLGFGVVWNIVTVPTIALTEKDLLAEIWKPIILAVANLIIGILLVSMTGPKDSLRKAKWYGFYKGIAVTLALGQLLVTIVAIPLYNMQSATPSIGQILNYDLYVLAGVSIILGIVHLVDWILYRIPRIEISKPATTP